MGANRRQHMCESAGLGPTVVSSQRRSPPRAVAVPASVPPSRPRVRLGASRRVGMAAAPASTKPAEVRDATDPIVQLLATISQDSQGMVAGADRLEEALAQKQVLFEQKIAPRSIGFHPTNRGGEGGSPLEVLRLASEIGEVGFSEREVRHALCIQAEPGDRSIEEFNMKLVADSGIAPVEPDTIMYGSLSGGHLNAALRCIAASVLGECKFLAEGGFMSVQKIRRRCPMFARAAEDGIT